MKNFFLWLALSFLWLCGCSWIWSSQCTWIHGTKQYVCFGSWAAESRDFFDWAFWLPVFAGCSIGIYKRWMR